MDYDNKCPFAYGDKKESCNTGCFWHDEEKSQCLVWELSGIED